MIQMRKAMLAILGIAAMLWTGCAAADKPTSGTGDQPEPEASYSDQQTSQAADNDFVYRLVSVEKEYDALTYPDIYAELEYVGDEPEIVIFHAASPFYFPMKETTRRYDLMFVMDQPLAATTLKRGEPMRQPYIKNGAYGAEDDPEYVAFMKTMLEQGFPEGHYVVKGSAQFYVESGAAGKRKKTEYHLRGEIDFKVVAN